MSHILATIVNWNRREEKACSTVCVRLLRSTEEMASIHSLYQTNSLSVIEGLEEIKIEKAASAIEINQKIQRNKFRYGML